MSDPYKTLVQSLSPALYWALDSVDGATDLSGNGRDGTGQGGVSIGGDPSDPLERGGSSTEFDGSNDRVTSSYSPFTNGTARTFTGWAYLDDDTTWHTLFGGDDPDAAPLLNISDSGDAHFWPNFEDEVLWEDAWPGTGEWVHWALVFDEANDEAELFINGESQGVKSTNLQYVGSPGNFQLAAYTDGTAELWDGKQAHVAVFDRVLDPEEIEALSEAPPIPDPDPFPESKFGFALGGDTHELSDNDLARELNAARAAGATWIRVDLHWAVVEVTEDVYDWTEFDRVVNAIRSRGMKPLGILAYTPWWASDSEEPNAMPDDPSKFGAFCEAAATRYKGKIDTYEIWNEPNLDSFLTGADPADYVVLLQEGYEGVKAADPGATVLTGGLSPATDDGTDTDPRTFLSGVYSNGGGDYFDAVAHHPYCWPAEPGEAEDWSAWYQMYGTAPSLRSIMVENGDATKRIWGTEWGVPTRGGTTDEEDQAEHLQTAYEEWQSYPWSGPLLVYELRDVGEGDTVGDSYGLLNHDFTPKLGYSTYQSIAPEPPPLPQRAFKVKAGEEFVEAPVWVHSGAEWKQVAAA